MMAQEPTFSDASSAQQNFAASIDSNDPTFAALSYAKSMQEHTKRLMQLQNLPVNSSSNSRRSPTVNGRSAISSESSMASTSSAISTA